MLRLENISKRYYVGDITIKALKKINLSFRKSEFVSILGPSGCGKTTFLNIIGGLDKYTKGDLFISGKSTKDFKDRDWDVYRNHRVGFVFQSYNLIPHQTVLGNVELALTIAGISKSERRERALNALREVGLENEAKKKPNQLSGGQCQRVAIARALINNPEILLADEPTGALDTVTSRQIMDLIKKISKDRLVIMVTHNPDLAKEYSTRIINLLDGWVVGDTNPFDPKAEIEECRKINQEADRKNKYIKKKERIEKAKMSGLTTFKLSLQNLHSKKGRTWMVAIAGSIGIIGVSMVLAISGGIHNYIDNMQDDLLSGYPLEIAESGYDTSSLMSGAETKQALEKVEIVDGKINITGLVEYLMEMTRNTESMQYQNNITADYVQFIKDMDSTLYSAIKYGYGIDPINNFYTDFYAHKNGTKVTQSLSSLMENYKCVLGETEYNNLSGYIDMFYQSVAQCPGNEDYILSQYDLLDGKVATEKDEIMVVVSKQNRLTDVALAQLGYYAQDEFLEYVKKADEQEYDKNLYKENFDYQEILDRKIYFYPNDDIYEKNTNKLKPTTQYTYNYKRDNSFSSGLEMKVVGILRPKETIEYGCLDSGFYYTPDFTKYFIEQGLNSEIVKYLKDSDSESFTSMSYNGFATGVNYEIEYEYEGEVKTKTCFVGQSSTLSSYLSIFGMGGSSGSMKTLSLRNLGGNDLPNNICIYPVNFEIKDQVTEYLDKWNNEKLDIKLSNGKTIFAVDREEIKYTDTIGIIIGLINNMINIVSYALIAFTALALVVSTVMIGIITYVSVVERIKEIGVIRSLGGRKKDVSNLFVAETFIIGSLGGAIGIGFTYFASFILNIVFKNLIGFGLCALPIYQAAIMLGVSIFLTLISGIIPAKSAARKDPVVALRSE